MTTSDSMQLYRRTHDVPPKPTARVRTYVQNHPLHGTKWCLRVTVYDDNIEVCARMWFEEYRDPEVPPPTEVLAPAIYLCENIARRALELGW